MKSNLLLFAKTTPSKSTLGLIDTIRDIKHPFLYVSTERQPSKQELEALKQNK